MFDNDYEEFFYSEDPQEIEKERKKKSALMSYFPKMLGTIDHTKLFYAAVTKQKRTAIN